MRSIGHRAPLLWLVLPFITGLAAAHAGLEWPLRFTLIGAATGAVVVIVGTVRRSNVLWAAGLCLAMTFSGLASYVLHRPRVGAWGHLPIREARVSLQIDRLFSPKDPKKSSGLATIVRADEHLRELIGQRTYFSFTLRGREIAPLRSAVIGVVGIVAPLPRDPPMDTFDGYLFNSGVNFRLTRGRRLRDEQAASRYQQFCARAAQKLSGLLGVGVETQKPDLTAVLRAMMLGQQGELSEDQDTLFMHSGTMHIFSISGLHIAVIAGGLHAMMSLLRIPRSVQFFPGLIALWLYVDITGCAPSAVRSFGMVAFLQTAFLFRVPTNPLASLTLSALVVLLASPLQLFSASFQMSYSIVAALLLLGLPLAEAWQTRWTPFRSLPEATWRWWHVGIAGFWRGFTTASALGVSSSLAGAVSGVLFFKLFTPGAILVNFALIPLSSLVILAGFLSLLGGLSGALVLSSLFNHAAILVLWIIDFLVRAFLRLPAMWFDARFEHSWIGSTALAVLLAVLLAGYLGRWEKRWGGFWPPFAIVAVTLVLAVKF